MPFERIPQLVQLSSNSSHYTVGCLVKPVIWSRPLNAETDGKLINDPLFKRTVETFGGKLEHWAISFYCSSDGATWEPWFTLEHLADPSNQAKLSEGDCSFRHGTQLPPGTGTIYCSEYLLDDFQQLCDKVDEVYRLSTNNCQHYAVNIHNAFTQAMAPQPPGAQTSCTVAAPRNCDLYGAINNQVSMILDCLPGIN